MNAHGTDTRVYRIVARRSSALLGDFKATDGDAALEALAHDAGYRDYVHVCEATGQSRTELDVTPLDEIATEAVSRCDRCGQIIRDLDAGFAPDALATRHVGCGGQWQRVRVPRGGGHD